ncbi:MAG: VCBS repeat-containing protein [Polyangiaceae bacterium]
MKVRIWLLVAGAATQCLACNGGKSVSVWSAKASAGHCLQRADTANGLFRRVVNYHDAQPIALAIADVDADGDGDVLSASANMTTIGRVSVRKNRGHAEFDAAQDYGVGAGVASLVVASLTRNGKPDIVSVSPTMGTVSVLHNRGDGTFQLAQDLAAGEAPRQLAASDLNGDGAPELVVSGAGFVSVAVNHGDGTFMPFSALAHLPLEAGEDAPIALGDFTADGAPDIAWAYQSYLIVFPNDGRGEFALSRAISSPLVSRGRLLELKSVHLNHDAQLDLVLESSRRDGLLATPLFNRGSGQFGQLGAALGDPRPDDAATNVSGPNTFALADIDGDALPDLVSTNASTSHDSLSRLSVALGTRGSFRIVAALLRGQNPRGVAAGDLDGDQRADLLVALPGGLTTILTTAGDCAAPMANPSAQR